MVGEALAVLGDELGLADPAVLAALTSRWAEVVGDVLGAHAQLRSLRDGVLTIVVDGGAWATELRYLEHNVLERVAQVTGRRAAREVRIVVGPTPGGEHRS